MKASRDVIAVYSTIDGMADMEADACWRLWSLQEIVERNSEVSPYGILFSDHMIDSWCYRLKYKTEYRSSVYIDYFDKCGNPEKLYDSLEEFFSAYLSDPNKILGKNIQSL